MFWVAHRYAHVRHVLKYAELGRSLEHDAVTFEHVAALGERLAGIPLFDAGLANEIGFAVVKVVCINNCVYLRGDEHARSI
jgi:hypothetical protein